MKSYGTKKASKRQEQKLGEKESLRGSPKEAELGGLLNKTKPGLSGNRKKEEDSKNHRGKKRRNLEMFTGLEKKKTTKLVLCVLD